MEISAWNPMNRTRRKKGPLTGLMTRVVTWRASPSLQFLCLRLYNRRRFFFLSIFLFTVFAVRCASVEFPHDATSSCRFFSFFFFFYTRQNLEPTHEIKDLKLLLFCSASHSNRLSLYGRLPVTYNYYRWRRRLHRRGTGFVVPLFLY